MKWPTLLLLTFWTSGFCATTDNIKKPILLAAVMDLNGRSKNLGQSMRAGLLAALSNTNVNGHKIILRFVDDSYTPDKTVIAVKQLIQQKPLVFIGNVGTPTAKVALPLLKKAGIPAFGFFTGSDLLRPGIGHIINYRASYQQEVAHIVDQALQAGISATEICAYVQNDAYGMSGVEGLINALSGKANTQKIIDAMTSILAQPGDNPERNGIGPVGVYQRNTFVSRPGYLSLKQWEQSHNSRCRLVITVGSYTSIANFIAYSQYKGDNWITSAISFTGASALAKELSNKKISNRLIMTQVTPLLSANIPIVFEAYEKLGDQLGHVSLEGYIVGKLLLQLLQQIEGEPKREKLVRVAKGAKFNLGGIDINFVDDNQASDLVNTTYLSKDGWKAMNATVWKQWLQ